MLGADPAPLSFKTWGGGGGGWGGVAYKDPARPPPPPPPPGFKAPLVFSVGRGIVPDVPLYPGSGIKQADPLSPAIFVMACSVLVPTLQKILPDIHVLFYADDLLIYIPLPPAWLLGQWHYTQRPSCKTFT